MNPPGIANRSALSSARVASSARPEDTTLHLRFDATRARRFGAQVVEQIEEASGRRVVAKRTVDPDIIGGIVVQAGSVRADASVRGRLDQLREELINR